ncbi:ferritin-like domain-containing protein [Mycobacteroides sp. LB1]|uniref:ferritin-like domain-containing protein n=1 Tax=Mycobacteroides sp. LB1 TaxID=2750814 RepID=UPI0015DEBCD0|nr:ferritin-like domain-containing protein [Mycobacteroides sp. LB1]
MAVVLEDMLQTIKDKQWALADVDWDAPGAEQITDEQRPKLKAFMADLVWIENIGARGFSALAKKAPNETLAEIYRYFHAEEQKHANAELALMRRWGMLEKDEVPVPNVNVRLAIEWLDRYSDGLSLTILGTIIPLLEVALDGALLKFLLEEVNDPICHEAFRHINSDESRHLAVDFHVLDMMGQGTLRRVVVENVGTVLNPSLLMGLLLGLGTGIPLINRIKGNLIGMGLREQRLYDAMERFVSIGNRGKGTRLLVYQVLRLGAKMITDPENRLHGPYHAVANSMVRLSDYYPRRWLAQQPSWSKELTYEATA